jgi:hypothetical protein
MLSTVLFCYLYFPELPHLLLCLIRNLQIKFFLPDRLFKPKLKIMD